MLIDEIKKTSITQFKSNSNKIITCVNYLNQEELWKDYSPHLISVGNLILHLIGNISQHLISGLGGSEYFRERDREFSNKPDYSINQLKDLFTSTINKAIKVIGSLTEEALTKKYYIQGKEYSGVEDLIHVVEHLSYHTAQIIWIVKYFKNADLDFYKGQDLNKQNIL